MKGFWLLTDMTDENIFIKEFDKLSIYKDLVMEVQNMWKLNTVVPVLVRALGTIKEVTKKHIQKISWRAITERNPKDCLEWHNAYPGKSIFNVIIKHEKREIKNLKNTRSNTLIAETSYSHHKFRVTWCEIVQSRIHKRWSIILVTVIIIGLSHVS